MDKIYTVIAGIFMFGMFALVFSGWILIFCRGFARLFRKFSKWGDFEIEKTPDGGIIVKKYVGSSNAVVVPKGATVIGEGAFAGRASVEIVSLPIGLKTIEMGAFAQCVNLTQVRFSEGLETIKAYAFSSSPIQEVVLPSSLKEVEPGAFSICKSFVVAEGNANYATRDGVLFTRDMSTLARYPGGSHKSRQYRVPETVKRIAEEAFSNSLFLRKLELPNGLEEIGDYAFLACRLDEITIPASVTKIGVGAFTQTGKIVVSEENRNYAARDGVLFSRDMKTLVSFPGGRFTKEYRVPDGVERIEEKAFYYVMTLESVVFPETLNSAGDCAFYGCKELTNVVAPHDAIVVVTLINPRAFENCPKLKGFKEAPTQARSDPGAFKLGGVAATINAMNDEERFEGDVCIEYGFDGDWFVIERGDDALRGRYAAATRFIWEMNGKEVEAKDWIERYKEWDPDCLFHGWIVLGAQYEQAYQSGNLRGALAVGRVASELNIIDVMIRPMVGSVWHKDLLLMDPVEAFQRFRLDEA